METLHYFLLHLQVNDVRLRTAGEASQRSTKEDWAEWMRHFSIELLKESPSPALRTCARLAQLQVCHLFSVLCVVPVFDFNNMQPSVGRELFAAGFASCWVQMNESSQEQLVRNLKTAFSSQNIPPEILATLLNLVCSLFVHCILLSSVKNAMTALLIIFNLRLIRQSLWNMRRSHFLLIPGYLVLLLKRLFSCKSIIVFMG